VGGVLSASYKSAYGSLLSIKNWRSKTEPSVTVSDNNQSQLTPQRLNNSTSEYQEYQGISYLSTANAI